ncbi:MAG: Rieske (2Fe-2S) protein [Chloroflexota bacterium]
MGNTNFVHAAQLADLSETGCKTVQLNGHTIAIFARNGHVFAVDNRCPHMGFPLDQGTVKDGILTCNWHYARFDLESGGTFDQWADDVRAFPAEVRDGEVWVDLARHSDPKEHQRDRLKVGLERNISLVIGKAVLTLMDGGADDGLEPFRAGLEFGSKYRQAGWGQGLTILACMMNMLPHLDAADKPRALYQGLSAVASDTAGWAPRFPIRPLPTDSNDIATLKRWFRQFIEVRDAQGAERCIISAIRAGASHAEIADMFFAAVTDHRYLTVGHVADFTNKAFEALDLAGWEYAEPVLTSLTTAYAMADRMEESNAWRHPIDLIDILHNVFAKLPDLLEEGEAKRGTWHDRFGMTDTLLSDNPQAIADTLMAALANGATEVELAEAVTYAAALRIARFHTSNEFGDWDTALHTFTFSNAIMQGLHRAPSVELLRGVFDAAMSVYLDRFLNIPAAKVPQPNGNGAITADLLSQFPSLLDRQQQVNEAGQLVAKYLYADGNAAAMKAMLGRLLLREDRDFHTIQTVETAFNLNKILDGTPEAVHALVAAARYLAAHAPTVRSQGQTYQIAHRLHRGDHLFEE